MGFLLAQFWGLTFVILGVIFLIRRENIRLLIKMAQDDTMIMITGYMALITGIAHVILYNVWSSDWRVIITLIGWMALAKGIMRLTFPVMTKKIIKSYDTSTTIGVALVVLIIIGLFLLIKGFKL